jgi:GNAT superfamily N-acetyltransferase
MNKFNFKNFQDQNDLEQFFSVLKELRTDLAYADFLNLYQQANAQGYTLVGLEYDNKILAVMGYRIITDFVHGRHLYIDDLVCTEFHRSQGLGAQLLKHAEELAKKMECRGLRLCTGIENDRGKKFYDRHGWNLRAVAYKKKLNYVNPEDQL